MQREEVSTLGFRRDIEGLRAIAVAGVLLFHATVPGFGGGFTGVDVFFVLSGYLMTALLVKEYHANGRLDFARFYARRARRLLPAAGLVAAVTLVACAFVYAPLEIARYSTSALTTFGYVSNLRFASYSQDYFAPETETDPFLHTWSLAVEEQFYLLWPIVLLFALRSPRRLVALLATVFAGSFALSLVLTELQPQWAFFLVFTRAWEFAAGGLAWTIPLAPLEVRWRAALGWAGLAGLALTTMFLPETVPFPGVAAVLPVVSCVLVLRMGATAGAGLLDRLLALPPVQRLGRISYGAYLWHWPLLVIPDAAFGGIPPVPRLGLLALSILLAEAMYRWVEQPIRHSRVLMPRPAMTLAAATAMTLAGLIVSQGATVGAVDASQGSPSSRVRQAAEIRPPAEDEMCLVPFAETQPVECAFGDLRSSTTVVLFGDSHATQWFPALERIALAEHWKLITLVKASCTVAEVPVYNNRLRREFTECEQWRSAAIDHIRAVRPRLVVISNYSNRYGRGPMVTARGGPDTFAVALRHTLARFDEVGIRTLLIQDSPQLGFDVPLCLRRALHQSWMGKSCEAERETVIDTDVYRAERRAAAELDDVSVFDPSKAICPTDPCQASMGETVKYRDYHHLSVPFVVALTGNLQSAIARIVFRPSAGPRAAADTGETSATVGTKKTAQTPPVQQ